MRAPSESGAKKSGSLMAGFLVPMVTFFLLYMVVMTSAPRLLSSVIEEKQTRIAEVLLGCVSPMTLMAGKLFGATSVGLTRLVVYGSIGLAVAGYLGLGEMLTPLMLGLTVVNVTLALVMYGSLYLAVGAPFTDARDAQGMALPVMLVIMVPMMAMTSIIRDPHGMPATFMSLFPLTAPLVMPMRAGLTTVPWWQIGLSGLLEVLTTMAIVWAAGRIFRVGILAQGQPPTIREVLRWVW